MVKVYVFFSLLFQLFFIVKSCFYLVSTRRKSMDSWISWQEVNLFFTYFEVIYESNKRLNLVVNLTWVNLTTKKTFRFLFYSSCRGEWPVNFFYKFRSDAINHEYVVMTPTFNLEKVAQKYTDNEDTVSTEPVNNSLSTFITLYKYYTCNIKLCIQVYAVSAIIWSHY